MQLKSRIFVDLLILVLLLFKLIYLVNLNPFIHLFYLSFILNVFQICLIYFLILNYDLFFFN
jgi:hypothetical protein